MTDLKHKYIIVLKDATQDEVAKLGDAINDDKISCIISQTDIDVYKIVSGAVYKIITEADFVGFLKDEVVE